MRVVVRVHVGVVFFFFFCACGRCCCIHVNLCFVVCVFFFSFLYAWQMLFCIQVDVCRTHVDMCSWTGRLGVAGMNVDIHIVYMLTFIIFFFMDVNCVFVYMLTFVSYACTFYFRM